MPEVTEADDAAKVVIGTATAPGEPGMVTTIAVGGGDPARARGRRVGVLVLEMIEIAGTIVNETVRSAGNRVTGEKNVRPVDDLDPLNPTRMSATAGRSSSSSWLLGYEVTS